MKYYIAMWASLILSVVHGTAESALLNVIFCVVWLVLAMVYGYLAIKDEHNESH